jgi:hypothetical protein
MGKACFFLVIFFLSCQSRQRKETLQNGLTGNWLVVYPDHQLRNETQEKIYAAIQDSVVGLKGLKLISFFPDGHFTQTDSLSLKGKWGVVEDTILYIRSGGEGFENFNAALLSLDEEKMELAETLQQGGERLKIVWHVKKVEADAFAAELFTEEANRWRHRPFKEETEEALRERLSAMLHYYAVYFRLVSEEASYFMTGRVPLPFEFYQHAMGLKPVNENGRFAKLFFNHDQLKKAHRILEQALHKLRNDFPSGKDFVIEYSLFMGQLAKAVKNP